MRKPVTIALITLHLFSNTELSMVFRLPDLISHYFQHHRQDPQISFIDFIAMHYGGNDGTTADDDEDNRLPLHQQRDVHSFVIVFSPMTKTEVVVECPVYSGNQCGGRIQTDTPSKHVLMILQPPRLS